MLTEHIWSVKIGPTRKLFRQLNGPEIIVKLLT